MHMILLHKTKFTLSRELLKSAHEDETILKQKWQDAIFRGF